MSEQRHTADHLSSVLEGMLENWGIKKEEVSLRAKNYLFVGFVENYLLTLNFRFIWLCEIMVGILLRL